MKHTRWIAMLLVLCMVVCFLPARASAVVSELDRENGWIVGVDDRFPNDYMIIGYTGSQSTVTIPTKVAGWVIDGVLPLAFRDNTKVKTINVPDGMTVSFAGSSVETVKLGKNVTLSSEAFKNCTKLKNVNLPEGMKVISSSLFDGCTGLTAVTIPEGVETIGEAAFRGCTGLTALVLPSSVEVIRSRAFYNCSNLKSINIPASVEEIGAEEVFSGCLNLAEIKVESGNAYYYNDSEGNLCSNFVENSVDHVALVRSVTGNYGDSYVVPSYFTYLDRGCFAGVAGLKKLVIPSTIINVEYRIVGESPDLKEVWFEGYPDRLRSDAFDDATLTVYYPGDIEQWNYVNFENFWGELTWIAYCSGIHKGPEGTVIEESTCTQPGSAQSVCELCGETYIYELPLVEHTYDEGVVTRESTCSEHGEILYTCTVCGETKTEALAKPPHDYDEGTYVKEPTCTAKGELHQKCRSCGSQRITYPSRLGHDYSVVKSVYDETGWNHIASCSRCDVQLEPEACTFDVVVSKEATLDSFGVKKHTCTVCGGSYEAEYVYRISGKGRCETAYAAADLLKETLGIEKFDAIIIASGTNFADALAGSFLAAQQDAPILLFQKGYEDENLNYITSNLAPGGKVYILGGSAAVPEIMVEALADFDVERLSGKSRFDTNLKILEEGGVTGQEILISTGWNFADCLSASATGLPILMVDSKSGKLTDAQIEFLEAHKDNTYTIIGGSAAVSEELKAAIETVVGSELNRLSGKTREATSVKVAETYFTNPDYALLAYSRNFPDGLCGGPLAHAMGAPLLLIDKKYESAPAEYIAANGIEKGAILGGSAAVSDDTGRIAFGLE